jgi:hypothetical protein
MPMPEAEALAYLREMIRITVWDLRHSECAELCEWNGCLTPENAAALRLLRDRLETALAKVR